MTTPPGPKSAEQRKSANATPAAASSSSSSTDVTGRRAASLDSIHSVLTSVGQESSTSGLDQSAIETNAISSILNSISDLQAAPAPTTRDIPPVVLTNINLVPQQAFDSYIKSISAIYEEYRHLRNTKVEFLGSALIPETTTTSREHPLPARRDSLASRVSFDEDGDSAAAFIELLDSKLLRHGSTVFESNSSKLAGDDNEPRRRRHNSVTVAPLSTIPSVYFSQDFKLENPRIFDVVSEKSEILSSSASITATSTAATAQAQIPGIASAAQQEHSTRKSLANNAILQEKLSWYLDIVEVHLINEISKASPSFFAALGDLRNLHTETRSAVEKIEGLREDLKRVDSEQAQFGLEILRLQQRRENVQKLEQASLQIVIMMELADNAEKLWQDGSTDECWDQTLFIEEIITGTIPMAAFISEIPECKTWRYPLSDLSTVPGTTKLQEKLGILRSRVTTEYQIRFTGCLLEDLRRHVASVPTQETLDRLTRTYTSSKLNRAMNTPSGKGVPINTTYMVLPENLKPQIAAHLRGLAKVGAVDSGMQRYRDAIMRDVRNLIKRNLPTNTNDDTISVSSSATGRTASTAQKSATLERMLREMRPQEFESMLVDIFTGISELLRRLSVQQKLLLDITSSMDTILDISDVIMDAVDITQARTVRIINVRRDLHAYADPATFASFYNLNRMFLAECEAITGKFGSALLQTVMAQQPQQGPPQQQGRTMH
ncbi:uncharacterized protein V1518DRAFT_413655 [Limtongia smithiae]|uniref:uncharacterized protein n=1 Tax=Limtongia smithiae TaxID=1125753 RepID=UPI0034CE61B6